MICKRILTQVEHLIGRGRLSAAEIRYVDLSSQMRAFTWSFVTWRGRRKEKGEGVFFGADMFLF